MYMFKVDLQVFPSKRPFFLFVCLVSSPHAPLFSLAAQTMMLQRWKTAGVIFTGRQGTWVIKLASIFHRQKKKTLAPVKAQDLCGKSVSVCGRGKMCSSRHTIGQGGLTSDMGESIATPQETQTFWSFLTGCHNLIFFSVIAVVLMCDE